MGKIYVNQSKLRLQLNTRVDLTEAKSVQIKYIKPGNPAAKKFTAIVLNAKTGSIYYDFKKNELDIDGTWIFWAFVTFNDDTTAPGEAVKIKVYKEGS